MNFTGYLTFTGASVIRNLVFFCFYLIHGICFSQQLGTALPISIDQLPLGQAAVISIVQGEILIQNENGKFQPLIDSALIQPGTTLLVRKGASFSIGSTTIGQEDHDRLVAFPSSSGGVLIQSGVSGPSRILHRQTEVVDQREFVPIENWRVVLLTARTIVKVDDVRDITTEFNFEGRIHAHATLTSQPNAHSAQPYFEIKWYHDDKLVHTQKAEYRILKSPFYLTSSTSGAVLGAGPARVDLLGNGKLLASHVFRVKPQ